MNITNVVVINQINTDEFLAITNLGKELMEATKLFDLIQDEVSVYFTQDVQLNVIKIEENFNKANNYSVHFVQYKGEFEEDYTVLAEDVTLKKAQQVAKYFNLKGIIHLVHTNKVDNRECITV